MLAGGSCVITSDCLDCSLGIVVRFCLLAAIDFSGEATPVMTKITEKRAMMAGSIIGLVCLLSYTFVHTGALLARYTAPRHIGYVAAFGIELMVALLAWRYARASKSQRSSGLVFALSAALAVSALANVAEGFAVHYGEPLTWLSIQRIDYIQAALGIASTGLISFLVFALSDIVGGDVGTVVRRAATQSKVDATESQLDTSIDCSCGRGFATVQALSAHKRFCELQNVNGH